MLLYNKRKEILLLKEESLVSKIKKKLDDKARNFMKKAKASGMPKEKAMQFLSDKGYDLGIQAPQEAQVSTEAPIETVQQPIAPVQEIQPLDPQNIQALQQAGLNPEAIQQAYGRQMTPEDVTGLISSKQGLENQPGIMSEFGKELIDPVNVKNALRSGGKFALDAASLGLAGGFADEIEAGIRAGLTDKSYEEVMAEIDAEYEQMPPEARTAETMARIAGSVMGGSGVGKLIGSKALGATASMGGRAGAGALGAFGESDGDIASTALGAGLGVVSPALAKGVGKVLKGTGKLVEKGIPEKVKDNAVYLARHLTTTKTPAKTILEIASDEKLTSKVSQGIDVSKAIASKARPKIVQELKNTPSRVQKSVLNTFGVDDVEGLQKVAKKDYQGWFDTNKSKSVGKDLMDDVFNVGDKDLDRVANTAYIRAIKDNPQLKKLPKNSVAVMQDVKSKLAEEGRKNTANSGYADTLKKQINTHFEELGGDYANINTNYAKSISKKKIAENMTSLKGRMSRNFAEGLDTFQNYDSIKSEFGEEIADGMQSVLEKESGVYKNLQLINKSIDKKLAYKSGAKAVKEAMTPRNIAATAALGVGGAVSAPLAFGAGAVGGGAMLGLNQMARGGAENILSGTRQLDPFLKSILASQSGAYGSNIIGDE
jgi:hypothetical protein